MTLIITMIRPEGIWQSADNRVTRGDQSIDDERPQQLHIICPPLPGGPQLLLAFTGLAELPDGSPTIQWARETLRRDNPSFCAKAIRNVSALCETSLMACSSGQD